MITDNKKYCFGCKQWKGLKEFYKHKNTVDGYSTQCSKCKKSGTTKWWHRTKKERLKKYSDRYKEIKERCLEYKGNKCSVCGITYNGDNSPIFDFHHTINKEFGIGTVLGSRSKSWEKLIIELDKCIVVCSNCHRMIHFDYRREQDNAEKD